MEFLKRQRYPGRFIILGEDAGQFVAIYGATGRHASSLNRRYERKGNDVVAVQLVPGGNSKLLTYPAMRFLEDTLLVANGRQIEKAEPDLEKGLATETCEPDSHKTPRITGAYRTDTHRAKLHIVRSSSGGCEREVWDIHLIPRVGNYIATYTGEDVRPTPSFQGNPRWVPLEYGSAKAAAEAIFNSLAPKEGEQDYRVGVVACYLDPVKDPETAIINRQDLV